MGGGPPNVAWQQQMSAWMNNQGQPSGPGVDNGPTVVSNAMKKGKVLDCVQNTPL